MKISIVLQLFLYSSFFYKSHAKLKNRVLKIDESSWRDMLEGEWLIKFYAPWCPACKGITLIWEKVADWSEDLNIKVGEVDVSEEAGLSGRFFITALPTIYHVKDGEFRRYIGSRTEDDIINYIEDERYKEVETVTWWKHPNSFQMSLLSSVFKVSMQVRIMHNKMTEEWGFPFWLSYLVFAVATIITGLLLGLVFVVIADNLCPPRPPPVSQLNEPVPGREPMVDTKKDEGDDEEDTILADEVIKGETQRDEDTTLRQRKVGDKEENDTIGEKENQEE